MANPLLLSSSPLSTSLSLSANLTGRKMSLQPTPYIIFVCLIISHFCPIRTVMLTNFLSASDKFIEMSLPTSTNCIPAKPFYGRTIQSDWLKLAMSFSTANQSALVMSG